jgi:hypothetical protein
MKAPRRIELNGPIGYGMIPLIITPLTHPCDRRRARGDRAPEA